MKIAITGGHFSPALALIREMKSDNSFIIIGRKHSFEGDSGESFEYNVAQQENIPFYNLQTARLQRRLTQHTIPSLLKFPRGAYQAYSILKKERPDIVLSFGGYLAIPVAMAAKALSIPVIIHEQTQHAGLANKVIGKFADKILISFKSSHQYFPEHKTVLTGNPVRNEIFSAAEQIPVPKGLPVIYITGGSAGSHAINTVVQQSLPLLLQKYVVIHQTGDAQEYKDFDNLVEVKNELPEDLQKNYHVTKYVFPNQIGWIYKNADLIVSRAGMNTVYEIMALRKMSLLIPLPYGQTNEQRSNARLIKKIGLGEYIEQKDLNSDLLVHTINDMLGNKVQYENVEISEDYFIPDAIHRIIHELQLIYEKKTAKK